MRKKGRQKKSNFLRLLGLGIVLIGICANGSVLGAQNGSQDEKITLLNPFDLEQMIVNIKTVPTVVVLRSSVSLRTTMVGIPLGSSLSSGTQYIFRNSVVRCPFSPEVRSGSTPD
jgi:hypothetical protein